MFSALRLTAAPMLLLAACGGTDAVVVALSPVLFQFQIFFVRRLGDRDTERRYGQGAACLHLALVSVGRVSSNPHANHQGRRVSRSRLIQATGSRSHGQTADHAVSCHAEDGGNHKPVKAAMKGRRETAGGGRQSQIPARTSAPNGFGKDGQR